MIILYFKYFFYNLITIIKLKSRINLNNKLKKFQKFNPLFGRKIIKLNYKIDTKFKKKSFVKCYEFNDKHIAFYDNDCKKFLTNQLSINDSENNDSEDNDSENNDSEDEEILNPYGFVFPQIRPVANYIF